MTVLLGFEKEKAGSFVWSRGTGESKGITLVGFQKGITLDLAVFPVVSKKDYEKLRKEYQEYCLGVKDLRLRVVRLEQSLTEKDKVLVETELALKRLAVKYNALYDEGMVLLAKKDKQIAELQEIVCDREKTITKTEILLDDYSKKLIKKELK